jgi:hypothetical protein
MRSVVLITLLVFLGWQGVAQAEEDLVAMLRIRSAPDVLSSKDATGLIVHQDAARAVIATAAHTLDLIEGEEIYIEFFSERGSERIGRVLFRDDDLDLAFVETSSDEQAAIAFQAAQQVLVPSEIDDLPIEGVFAIGNPSRIPWGGNRRPGAVLSSTEPGVIEFQTNVVAEGMSGGGLFSDQGALLGMIYVTGQNASYALPIEVVQDTINAENLPFSLTENTRIVASMARRTLENAGEWSVAGVLRALTAERLDFSMLHLFWLGGFDPELIEQALNLTVGGEEQQHVERLIVETVGITDCEKPDPGTDRGKLVFAGLGRTSLQEGLSCGHHLRIWFEEILALGVNPDLVINYSGGWREAMLATAMRAKNEAVFMALIGAGASPNPYQDVRGREWRWPRFIDPIGAVREQFEGEQRDRFINALEDAGVVVVEGREGRETPSYFELEETRLCERASRRHSFNWCELFRTLPLSIVFETGVQEPDSAAGRPQARLRRPLFIDADRAFFLAERLDYFSGSVSGRYEVEPVIVEIYRDGRAWQAYWHADRYGCIARSDGFESRYCWRRYHAYPARFRANRRKADDRARFDEPVVGPLRSVRVEEVSLGDELTKAAERLAAQGYKPQFTGDVESAPRDTGLTAPFRLDLSPERGMRELKLYAFDGRVIAIAMQSFQDTLYNEIDTENDWADLFEDEIEKFERFDTRSGSSYMSLYAVDLQKHWRYGYFHIITDTGTEIFVGRRREQETLTEKMFQDFALRQWAHWYSEPEIQNGICFDDYSEYRRVAGYDCIFRE